jgi:hypothetical protein
MTDPFFMLMLIENLGPDHVVWDKSASIRFKKPGSGTVSASFRLADQQIDDIKQALKTEENSFNRLAFVSRALDFGSAAHAHAFAPLAPRLNKAHVSSGHAGTAPACRRFAVRCWPCSSFGFLPYRSADPAKSKTFLALFRNSVIR